MIDSEKATIEANRISSNAVDLQYVLKQITDYKASINANWKGPEIAFVNKALEEVLLLVKKSVNELNEISRDIKKAASDIKSEEDTVARAKAEKEKTVKAAQARLDKAMEELTVLNEKKKLLERKAKQFRNNPLVPPAQAAAMAIELTKISEKIKTAQQNCESCLNALKAAKR